MNEGHPGHRHHRLQQLIDEELTALIRDEAQDPLLDDVRLTAVELSVDYKSARVRWIEPAGAAEPTKPQIAKMQLAFERASAFLRARLGEALDLKKQPTLTFVYDRVGAAAARAVAALDEKKI